MTATKCPLWGTPAEELPRCGDLHEFYSPVAGGWYAITGPVRARWERTPPDDRQKMRFTRWITNQHHRGEECPVIRSDDLAPEAA
jgi:hypothetical protein